MANLRNLNNQNPFWDFLSSLNIQGGEHPLAAYDPSTRETHAPPPEYGNTPPPPPPPADEVPPPPRGGPEHHPHHGPPPHSPYDHPFGPGFPFGGRRGGPHHHGGPRRGSWGGRGRSGYCGNNMNTNFGGWPTGGFDMSKLAEFVSQFVPNDVASAARENTTATAEGATTANSTSKDFAPEADIFDTEDAYIVHISLPGAKKEDVGVNWDADKSELSVAGVIYRPGDEDLLKTLALDERRVGVFERKVRLGSRASPAQVESDAISAKMEDGILMVTIPKTDQGFVEVKKVDIE